MAAGLLDFLGSDEAALGMGLLAAGGPSTDPNMGFGARLAGAQQMVKANQAAALKAKLIQSQLAENESQAAYRAAQVQDMQRKQEALAGFLQRFQGGAPPPEGPAMGGALPGPMAGGVGGVQAPGGSPMGAGGASPGWSANTGGVRGLSVDDLAAAKIAGLPDLTEIAKISLPKWEFQNNTWVNTNDPNFKGGPSEGVMNTPQGPMRLQLGPDGNPSVTPVRGSLDALTAAEDRKNLSAAKTTESSKPIYNEATQRWDARSKADVLGLQEPGAAPAPAPRVTLPGRPFGAAPGYGTEAQMKGTVAGDMGADPAAAKREIAAIERDLAAPGKVPDQASRQMLAAQVSDLRRQLGNIGDSGGAAAGAGRGSGGAVVQLSAAEEAANKAAEARMVEQAKSDVTPTAQKVQKYTAASDAVELIDKALAHPGLTKATGLGVWNPINKIPGTQGKDFEVLRDQLKGTAFLSAYNELKGGGAITETEGTKAENAIARMNIAQSEKSFREALTDYRTILQRGMNRSASSLPPGSVDDLKKLANTGGASGQWGGGEKKNIVPDLPKTAPVGARARDTVTGKILKFDGMIWKPE